MTTPDMPLPDRACIVTNTGTDRPLNFMISTKQGVALMQQSVGSKLDLYTADQMRAHREEYAEARVAARDAEIAVLRENGPIMQRGIDGDGKIVMGTMRDVMGDYASAAATEAQWVNEARAEVTVLRAGCIGFRDAVLNSRLGLAENGMTSEQTNDVLGLYDDTIGAALTTPITSGGNHG